MSANPKIVNWRGRRVWLVGASSGIGAALAQQLHAAGARLALSARRPAALVELGLTDAEILPLDVTDAAAVAAGAEHLLQRWGEIDLVFYLAGDYQPMAVTELDAAAMRRLWEVNYGGAVHLVAALQPAALAGRVHGLALMASVAGYRGLPQALAYGPPKAALIQLAEILHLELAPRGVAVWLINPGFVATRLTAQNSFRMPALLTPQQAAAATLRGLAGGGFEIAYPRRFTSVLRAITRLPYAWYFWLVRRLTGIDR